MAPFPNILLAGTDVEACADRVHGTVAVTWLVRFLCATPSDDSAGAASSRMLGDAFGFELSVLDAC